MAGYIGHRPPSTSAIVDEFTSTAGTTYTLSQSPLNIQQIQVSAGGLVQQLHLHQHLQAELLYTSFIWEKN